ncbi:MAG TPA: BatD family protein [Rubricoccaceae bacterium]|nr:BatD family protein [Rubricoccaceae bacterium]
MRLFAFILLAASWSAASAQVAVHAYVDRTVVGAGEIVTYTLEARGDLRGLGDPEPPPARGLTLVQRTPTLRSFVRSSGGADELTVRWRYRAERSGTAELGPARVPISGRVFTTDPIRVEVSGNAPSLGRPAPSPSPDPPSSGSDLFVRAEPSSRRVVVGEQVVVDYVLYFAPHLQPRRSQVTAAWDTQGFWREELEVPPALTVARSVAVGGRAMMAVTVRRVALFPTRTGPLDLGPLPFEVDLVRSLDDDSPFAPFFNPFAARFDTELVRAPALTLVADPLPPGAPAGFSGAVGRFAMEAALERPTARAGEPVQLTVTIRGTGNIATLGAPALGLPPALEAFDPDEARNVDRNAAPLVGEKTFTFTLVPRQGGRAEIPALAWSYFDPEARIYRTLGAGPFTLTVRGPAAPAAAATEAGPDPNVPMGLMTHARWRRAGDAPRSAPLLLAGGVVLPLLALVAVAAARRRKDREAASSPERTQRRAPSEARRRLRVAHQTLEGSAFYAEVERLVRAFLSDRLGLPGRGLSRTALDAALAQRGASEVARAEVSALLAACELGQFAPGASDDAAARAAVAARAERLLAALEAPAGAEVAG